MTSRLKKKLGELGVDTASRRANENFCLIGTPLPPLEKSKDTGEFVPLWKQEVRDEKGRRRLHGAFTGGFSAGYFNTVGSKEGWTPSNFVSTRNDRAKKQAARPEDFMDEEDLQDIKDSRNLVDTTEQMDFLGGTQGELGLKEVDESEKDPISRALEASLLPAPKDSVGAKILKKMGWRLGQGIGPRVTLARRREQDSDAYDALTGSRLNVGNLDIPPDDDEAAKHTYAPRDTPVLVVKRKDNTHGLGYKPGMSLNESMGNTAGESSSGPRLAGGFGLGALNDADEDDLDVYDSAQQSSRRRVAYDNIDNDEDRILLGSQHDKRKPSSTPIPKSSSQHFRDGRQVLAGFILSEEPVAEDRWFPLPEIPPGWKPDPKRVWAKEKENQAAPPTRPAEPLPHAKWKSSKISADQRGAMLGETPLPSGPKSVFDYMSEKDKERIKRIAAGLASGQSQSYSGGRAQLAPQPSSAKLDPKVAQAALGGFQPFTADPAKQARYTTYLQTQANPDGSVAQLRPQPGQTEDEFVKELEDYAKAASLFKPMSAAMAGRFTSAAVLDLGPKIIEGLHKPTTAELEAKEAERKKEEEGNVDPKAEAARMGMFGPLTREVRPWVPNRLLCKRFGVKEPEIASDLAGEPSAAPSDAPDASFMKPNFAAGSSSASKDATVPTQTIDGPRDLANVGFGEDETQGQDTLTYQRPGMDIFKAIFASDDEDSDEEEEADEPPPVEATSAPVTAPSGFTKATVILEDVPFDPAAAPVFIPREGKAKKSDDKGRSKDKKEKREKKKKDKEKKKVLVSFEMDEEGGDSAVVKQPKDRPTKKRKTESTKEDGDEPAMWDAPIPTKTSAPATVATAPAAPDVSGPKGRRRAVDFMD